MCTGIANTRQVLTVAARWSNAIGREAAKIGPPLMGRGSVPPETVTPEGIAERGGIRLGYTPTPPQRLAKSFLLRCVRLCPRVRLLCLYYEDDISHDSLVAVRLSRASRVRDCRGQPREASTRACLA